MQLMSIKTDQLCVLLLKTYIGEKGSLWGEAPQTLTRSYYFEPPLSKKRSRATGVNSGMQHLVISCSVVAKSKILYEYEVRISHSNFFKFGVSTASIQLS